MEPLNEIINITFDNFEKTAFYKKYFATKVLELDEFDEQYNLESYENGILLIFNLSKRCSVIFLFNDEENGFFKGVLSFGITFDMKKTDAKKILGKPNDECERGSSSILKEHINWCIYYFLHFSLHLEFNKKDELVKVTLINKGFVA